MLSPTGSQDDIRASALSLQEGSWSEGIDGEDLAKLKEHSVFDGSRRHESKDLDEDEDEEEDENSMGLELSEEELLAEVIDDEIVMSPMEELDESHVT